MIRYENVCILILLFVYGLQGDARLYGQNDIFSGPQVGEKLSPFKVRGVFDKDAGVEMDFVSAAKGKPIVLIFVHEVDRPSLGFTRTLTQYTHGRAKDGLTTGVVWLNDDLTEGENALKRVRHALTAGVPTGISIDGREGPGSYGLHRKVSLTILVGNQDRVTGNFALVQPSLQSDLPKVLESVVALMGGPMPKLEELVKPNEAARKADRMESASTRETPPNLRPYLAPLIRLDAPPESVDKAAIAILEVIEKDGSAKTELVRIATTIVNSGRLESYGTPRAREWLAQWAKDTGKRIDLKTGAPPVPSDRK
jgi:hypothetical protein